MSDHPEPLPPDQAQPSFRPKTHESVLLPEPDTAPPQPLQPLDSEPSTSHLLTSIRPLSRPISRIKRKMLDLTELPGVLIVPAHAPVRTISTQTPDNSTSSPYFEATFQMLEDDLQDSQNPLPCAQTPVTVYHSRFPAGDGLVEDQSLQSLFGVEANQPKKWRKRLKSVPMQLMGQRSTGRLMPSRRPKFQRVSVFKQRLVLKSPHRSSSGESRSDSSRSRNSRSPLPFQLTRHTPRAVMMRNLPGDMQLPQLRPRGRG